MSGAFDSPRQKRRPSINIAPLIDVMLLLLIFFMVSSTFKESLGIDITLPEAEHAAEQDLSSHEIVVDREGKLYFGERAVDEEGLRAALVELIAATPDAVFVLRADAEADFGRVVRAIDIVRDVGGERLVIPTDLLRKAPGTP